MTFERQRGAREMRKVREREDGKFSKCAKERTARKKREIQGEVRERERYIYIEEVDFGCERSTRTQ